MMTRRIYQMHIDIETENDRKAGLTQCPDCGSMVVNRPRALRLHIDECDGAE